MQLPQLSIALEKRKLVTPALPTFTLTFGSYSSPSNSITQKIIQGPSL